MDCNTCVIGVTLLLSSVAMIFFKQDKEVFIRFSKLLDDEQKKIYHKIIIERVKAYVSGIIAGVVAGLINYYRNPKQSYALCTFIAIVYLVKLGVYYFYPKSPLMLYSLKTKEQTDAWAKIYEEMKNRYKISLVIGFVGYIVLFRGL